jgi:hypothetical protein
MRQHFQASWGNGFYVLLFFFFKERTPLCGISGAKTCSRSFLRVKQAATSDGKTSTRAKNLEFQKKTQHTN